jgi:hypothetical protein
MGLPFLEPPDWTYFNSRRLYHLRAPASLDLPQGCPAAKD